MRRIRTIAGIFVLIVIALATALWWQSTALAERVIRAQLAARNIPVTSLSVSRVTPRSITLRDVVLGEGGAIRIARAEFTFSYDGSARALGAFSGELHAVDIRAQVQNGQLQLGGVEQVWSAPPVAATQDAITVQFVGDARVARNASGVIDLTLPQGTLSLSQKGKPILPPLLIEATARSKKNRVTAQGKFRDTRTNLVGTIDGDYALDSKTGSMMWNTKPMQFTETGFTFAQLSPAFADGLQTITSRFSLRGKVALAPDQWTVTPTITVLELPIERLLASVLGHGAVATGSVKGAVPIRIRKGGAWRIEKSRLVNIGPLAIRVDPQSAGQALAAHPQAALVQSALANLQVETLTLDVQSTDDRGGMKLDWHFIGHNPELLGGKKVDLTLAVTLNLEDMLRSMQEVTRATQEAEQLLLRKP